jgi:hypothetical protein
VGTSPLQRSSTQRRPAQRQSAQIFPTFCCSEGPKAKMNVATAASSRTLQGRLQSLYHYLERQAPHAISIKVWIPHRARAATGTPSRTGNFRKAARHQVSRRKKACVGTIAEIGIQNSQTQQISKWQPCDLHVVGPTRCFFLKEIVSAAVMFLEGARSCDKEAAWHCLDLPLLMQIPRPAPSSE